jgi:hypothetical protein
MIKTGRFHDSHTYYVTTGRARSRRILVVMIGGKIRTQRQHGEIYSMLESLEIKDHSVYLYADGRSILKHIVACRTFAK